MKDQWKERKRLRSEEVASIEKAIEILSSDEARDTMSSSFKSQGNFFLQEDDSKPYSRSRVRYAAKHFDKVVDGIDKMMADLHKENDMDLKVKEDCENDRDKNTKMSKNAAYAIDTQTAIIVRKKAAIDAKMAEIARLTEEKQNLMTQRDEATVARQNEAAEYAADKATDEAAVGLIEKAAAALAKFFEDNGLAGLQVSARSMKGRTAQPAVEAGAAPPPPPTTWSEPYGGAKGESNGVQSILSMIKADVEKDIAAATTAEEDAKSDFKTFMSESEATMEKIG